MRTRAPRTVCLSTLVWSRDLPVSSRRLREPSYRMWHVHREHGIEGCLLYTVGIFQDRDGWGKRPHPLLRMLTT